MGQVGVLALGVLAPGEAGAPGSPVRRRHRSGGDPRAVGLVVERLPSPPGLRCVRPGPGRRCRPAAGCAAGARHPTRSRRRAGCPGARGTGGPRHPGPHRGPSARVRCRRRPARRADRPRTRPPGRARTPAGPGSRSPLTRSPSSTRRPGRPVPVASSPPAGGCGAAGHRVGSRPRGDGASAGRPAAVAGVDNAARSTAGRSLFRTSSPAPYVGQGSTFPGGRCRVRPGDGPDGQNSLARRSLIGRPSGSSTRR